jgi:hypothetical protein
LPAGTSRQMAQLRWRLGQTKVMAPVDAGIPGGGGVTAWPWPGHCGAEVACAVAR